MVATSAAIIARARRTVLSHFLDNDAVTRERAIYFNPERAVQRRMLQRFLDQRVIVEAAPENYYLDVDRYEEWHRRFKMRIFALALFVMLAAIVAAFA